MGEKVSPLVIIDTGARRRPTGRFRWFVSFVCNIPWWVRYDLLESSARYTLFRIRRKLGLAVKWVGTRGSAQSESASRIRPEDIWDFAALSGPTRKLVIAHFEIWKEYVPRPYAGRVTLFRARAQDLFTPATVADLGWGSVATGGIDIRTIPANHRNLFDPPHVQVFAQRLQACLAEARQRNEADETTANRSMHGVAAVSSH